MYLWEPFAFLLDVLVLIQVDEVHHRLPTDAWIAVQPVCLFHIPVTKPGHTTIRTSAWQDGLNNSKGRGSAQAAFMYCSVPHHSTVQQVAQAGAFVGVFTVAYSMCLQHSDNTTVHTLLG